ncbi:MAG TPA: class I SAM-dependent methyltransferase, partial [Spirochaetia bacterium]
MSSSDTTVPGIRLNPGRDGPVRKRHHPWIYSQAVAAVTPPDTPSALLPVRSADGALVGWGTYSAGSLIAVRMVSFGDKPEDDWLERRIRAAKALRDALHVDSDAVRVVNSEGDFLPGLVADRYGDTLVLSAHTRAMEGLLDAVSDCLLGLFPGAKVFVKRDEHFARVEQLARPSGYIRGEGDGTAVIAESGTRLLVDFARGQKTGFYLDQRANRGIIAAASAGKTVLNLFSYTGAVALRALAAGAVQVTSVDSSRPALEVAERSA